MSRARNESVKRSIVLLTPLHLLADTRSLKQSKSFQRMGFNTIVVQDPPLSKGERDIALDVITLQSSHENENTSEDQGTETPGIRANLRRLTPRWIWEPLSFLWFVYIYLVKRTAVGFFKVPRADLYYLHEYRLYPLVWVLSIIHGAPFIYDAHDFYPEVHDKTKLTPFWRTVFMPFLNWLESRCAHRAAAIVTTSHGMAELIENHYGRRPIVLRNSYDNRLEIKPESGLRDYCGLGDEVFLIAIVGNDKPGQAIEQMMDAMVLLPKRVHVAFIGRYKESNVRLAKKKGLSGRVHFCGRVDARGVVPFIRSADVAALIYFPYTRNYQHFLPNGFFQSISAELPLLYPSLLEFKRIAGEHNIGICFDPMSPISIHDGVLSLMEMIGGDGIKLPDMAAVAEALSWIKEEAILEKLVNEVQSGARI